ncbi:MAG: hemolysin III family protein [Bifidobacteriaceae bacterium]|jgi:hemolysin III|nr:hemolysin III family protein [Bifidobacteriaceae bacterium]
MNSPTGTPEVSAAAGAEELVKPRMRGWLHAAMLPVSIAAGVVLIVHASGAAGKVGCSIFVATAIMLFGCSGVYHLGNWGRVGQAVLRRLDHSNIALVIAGTYTPIGLSVTSGTARTVLLALIWSGAAAAIAVRLIWINAPRWSYVPIYIALGWAALGFLPTIWRVAGPAVFWLLLAGGVAYTGGAVVYALKRPNPFPRWFGFHEIFHACTIIGIVCHYLAVWEVTAG